MMSFPWTRPTLISFLSNSRRRRGPPRSVTVMRNIFRHWAERPGLLPLRESNLSLPQERCPCKNARLMRTPSLALAATLCCVPALAAADPQPDLAARFEAEHPWSVGLRSGYTTIPNMILGALYTRY